MYLATHNKNMWHAVLIGDTRGVFDNTDAATAAAGAHALPLRESYATEATAQDALRVFDGVTDDRVVYVDGSSLKNGKPGAIAGFGVFYGFNDARNASALVRSEPRTNNVAELEGIEQALVQESNALFETPGADATPLVIVTDSGYSIKCLTKYYDAWVRNDWVTTAKTPVKNAELIRGIRALLDTLPHVRLFHVHGHVGIVGNEEADKLACDATSKGAAALTLTSLAAASGAAPSPSSPPATSGAASRTRRTRKRPAPPE